MTILADFHRININEKSARSRIMNLRKKYGNVNLVDAVHNRRTALPQLAFPEKKIHKPKVLAQAPATCASVDIQPSGTLSSSDPKLELFICNARARLHTLMASSPSSLPSLNAKTVRLTEPLLTLGNRAFSHLIVGNTSYLKTIYIAHSVFTKMIKMAKIGARKPYSLEALLEGLTLFIKSIRKKLSHIKDELNARKEGKLMTQKRRARYASIAGDLQGTHTSVAISELQSKLILKLTHLGSRLSMTQMNIKRKTENLQFRASPTSWWRKRTSPKTEIPTEIAEQYALILNEAPLDETVPKVIHSGIRQLKRKVKSAHIDWDEVIPSNLTVANLKTTLIKQRNWAAPGPDGIPFFFLKRFPSFLEHIVGFLNERSTLALRALCYLEELLI